ncbi:hypothetical protein BLNAU_5587 [Blattamonas nauphoetae]|uniref:Uncharacterized protein n=1 Tax=Blattamonas nauphoetae TaxID=2049346 RepID=A0ABQ9Y745_9EUKA|nr:hypothetical protein BLNAU_5587 [Blattamonas nauphoetae]
MSVDRSDQSLNPPLTDTNPNSLQSLPDSPISPINPSQFPISPLPSTTDSLAQQKSSEPNTPQSQTEHPEDDWDRACTPPMNSVYGIGAMSTLEDDKRKHRLNDSPIRSTGLTNRVLRETPERTDDFEDKIDSYSAYYLQRLSTRQSNQTDEIEDSSDEEMEETGRYQQEYRQPQTDYQADLCFDMYTSQEMFDTQQTIEQISKWLSQDDMGIFPQHRRTTSRSSSLNSEDLQTRPEQIVHSQSSTGLQPQMTITEISSFLGELCQLPSLSQQIEHVISWSLDQGIMLSLSRLQPTILPSNPSQRSPENAPVSPTFSGVSDTSEHNSSPFAHLITNNRSTPPSNPTISHQKYPNETDIVSSNSSFRVSPDNQSPSSSTNRSPMTGLPRKEDDTDAYLASMLTKYSIAPPPAVRDEFETDQVKKTRKKKKSKRNSAPRRHARANADRVDPAEPDNVEDDGENDQFISPLSDAMEDS